MNNFRKATDTHFDKLQLYVPTVARVHGDHHPEFHDVHSIYNEIKVKVSEAKADKPDLSHEFKQLREITDNYTVPGDVCESYEAVYTMLADIDEAYHT